MGHERKRYLEEVHKRIGQYMNREEIIRMAREAGGADISMNGWTSWVGTGTTEFLERFAALVASAEREACAQMLEAASKTGKIISCTSAAKAIRARGQT